jgi:hypothetical protein
LAGYGRYFLLLYDGRLVLMAIVASCAVYTDCTGLLRRFDMLAMFSGYAYWFTGWLSWYPG